MSSAPTPEPSAPAPAQGASRDPRAAKVDFDDPFGRPSADDTDRGWGERPTEGDSASDLARFLDEKPPHHF
ncbi:hypothetical protein ACFYYR_28845 [Streptomyces sp. NPDC001922]|uniref:hypothetical protein n=1 Tax=Streptomyces sp. NPDC001922 TaxID=3364624 RepID=UPI0036C6AF14